MKNAFQRCGSEDDSYTQIKTLSTDICQASKEILSAFSQWAETYLYVCRNNRVHTERMDTKWSYIYNEVLDCYKNQSVIVSTTESTSESTTTSTTTTVPSFSGTNYCTQVDPTRSYCWTLPSQYAEYDYYDNQFSIYSQYFHGDDRIDVGNTTMS